MLHTLARHAGQVLSREQLLQQVWGYDYVGDLRVVDAAIKRLRTKLRQALPESDLITTIRGVGYKLLAWEADGRGYSRMPSWGWVG